MPVPIAPDRGRRSRASADAFDEQVENGVVGGQGKIFRITSEAVPKFSPIGNGAGSRLGLRRGGGLQGAAFEGVFGFRPWTAEIPFFDSPTAHDDFNRRIGTERLHQLF